MRMANSLQHVAWEPCLIEPRPDRALESYARRKQGIPNPAIPYFAPVPWLARAIRGATSQPISTREGSRRAHMAGSKGRRATTRRRLQIGMCWGDSQGLQDCTDRAIQWPNCSWAATTACGRSVTLNPAARVLLGVRIDHG